MTSTVYQTKRLDKVCPTAGRGEKLGIPEPLTGFLAKIGKVNS